MNLRRRDKRVKKHLKLTPKSIKIGMLSTSLKKESSGGFNS